MTLRKNVGLNTGGIIIIGELGVINESRSDWGSSLRTEL